MVNVFEFEVIYNGYLSNNKVFEDLKLYKYDIFRECIFFFYWFVV